MDALTFKLAKAIVLRHERDHGADTPIELVRCKHARSTTWRGVVIVPSAKRTGWWQLSFFDACGFYGDSQHPSKVDAVKEAVLEGFVTVSRGRLEQAMRDGQWQTGVRFHDPERARKAHTSA